MFPYDDPEAVRMMQINDHDTKETEEGEQIVDHLNDDSLVKLKIMREKVNWNIKKVRYKFLRKLDVLINDWKGQIPNLRHIFRSREIECLLLDSINCRYGGKNVYQGEPFIIFVVLTGYKDEPELDKDGKPLLHHTTPLHYAVRRRFSNWSIVVRHLFEIYDKFDMNYTDEFGYTHFDVACMSGCYKAVEKFLELGQDLNCVTQKSVDPPLHLALYHGHEDVAELLLRKGANPNLANKDGLTPLHIICQRDTDLAEMFFEINEEVDQLVNVNVQDNMGNTALHLTLTCDQCEVSELLLNNGADPNVFNSAGFTPLHIICSTNKDNYYLAEMLFEITDNLNRQVQVDAQDKLGNTPLHLALMHGNKILVELLLRRGADPNLANTFGSTPLHITCKDCYDGYDLANLFFKVNKEIQHKVQIDARDKLGRTPLQSAVASLVPNMIDVLLDYGADLSSFVFPTKSHFVECFKSYKSIESELKLILASGMLAVIERLEKRGYRLGQSDVLTIVNLFAKYKLFDKSIDNQKHWYDDVKLKSKAKKIMINSNLSLYNFIRL